MLSAAVTRGDFLPSQFDFISCPLAFALRRSVGLIRVYITGARHLVIGTGGAVRKPTSEASFGPVASVPVSPFASLWLIRGPGVVNRLLRAEPCRHGFRDTVNLLVGKLPLELAS